MNSLLAAGLVVLLGATIWNPGSAPQEGMTIVVRDAKIAAVGRDLEPPRGATVLDLDGAIVTPGLVDAASQLGLVELTTGEPAALEGTSGGESSDPLRAALLAIDTFDPRALALEIARQQGITSAILMPYGGVISGQAAWVALDPDDARRAPSIALVGRIRANGAEPGARSRAFLLLRQALEDARLYRAPGNRGAYIRRNLRDLRPSPLDLDALALAVEGKLRFVFAVDRASDILTLIKIARDQKLEAVLLGAREGWRVAREIAAAQIPVIVDPLANLPEDFDSLDTHPDNARLLLEAGVRVSFMSAGPPTQSGRLRFVAGNAVARGFPRDAALEAITQAPLESFGLTGQGRIRVGARADLVVWNGDPFEPLTSADHVFVGGREMPLRTRQDLLTERYTNPASVPRSASVPGSASGSASATGPASGAPAVSR